MFIVNNEINIEKLTMFLLSRYTEHKKITSKESKNCLNECKG